MNRYKNARRMFGKHYKDIFALLAIIVVAAFVGGLILTNERATVPAWVPFVGTDFFTLKAEFVAAQALAPGQGQTVDIAGIKVGEVTNVEISGGRALIRMKIERRYAHVYANATLLLRPKTGLQDMVVQLNPGTKAAAVLRNGATIPVQNTLPNVNFDQILASLDADSQNFLELLIAGGGKGVGRQGQVLAADLRRFAPTARDLSRVMGAIGQRRMELRRLIHNFRLLAATVAGQDRELTQLIDSTNAVFETLAQQDENLRVAIGDLPQTLSVANRSFHATNQLARELRAATSELLPSARALQPTLVALRPFFKKTTPLIADQLRPFTTAALPTARALQPAVRDLHTSAPRLTASTKVLNEAVNELTFNPKGSQKGFLYTLGWANHNANSLLSLDDAHGVVRHALLLVTCEGLGVLSNLRDINPQINALIESVNPPKSNEVCSGTQVTATKAH